MPNKSFYIIDGHAQIYRAYFAPFRELSSPSGEPTKATFVFTQMLVNLVEQRRPDYLAMVIDKGGDEGVFRKQIYPEYKANRQPKPPDFPVQEKRILKIVEDAGVPIFGAAGFEADDLIATMCRRLCQQGFDIYIVSKDKDLRQMLSDCIRMYDVQSSKVVDAQAMREDCGYGPEQAVEVQTLMGDAIDNVPGIPGVGEKTAARLIAKYGSVDGIVAHADELTPKLRENVLKYKDLLPLSRKLVTLKDDVDFSFEPEACRFSGFNVPGVRKNLEELGFTSLIKRIESAVPAAKPQPPAAQEMVFARGLFDETPIAAPEPAAPTQQAGWSNAPTPKPDAATAAGCDYCLINTEELLVELISNLTPQKRFAFDTETDQLGAMRAGLVGLSVSFKEGTGYYIPVRGPLGARVLSQERVISALKPLLEDPRYEKVGHNIKYDMLVMRNAGVNLRGVVIDSMVAAFLLDASRMSFGIDRLALDLLNFRKITTAQMLGTGKDQTTMDRVPLEEITRYAAEDADIALRLANHLEKQLAEVPLIKKLNDDLETPLIDVLVDMEYNGVAVDPQMLREQSEVLGKRIADLRSQIMQSAGCDFNPDSPKQLADVLFNRLGLKPVKRTKTGPSTDVEVLEKLSLEHDVPKLLLEYRSLVKLKNTYLDNLTDWLNPRTRRIHACFNQTGAATGRLSCSDPNLQNIPIRTDEGRRIRLAFVAGDPANQVLLTADYSQIELRMLAHFTREPALVRAFEADEDIHAAVASEVFDTALDQVSKAQRAQAKIINFGIIYGVSAFGLARRIDGLSVKAAQDLINAYNKRFPSIERFLQECVMQAKSLGYVETILGRRRPIPEINSPVMAIRNGAERMAINSVVQGSAADLIKIAMRDIWRRIKREDRPSRMLLQVHDELVFEVPKSQVEDEAGMIRQEMNGAGAPMGLQIPLKVDVGWGKNWEEGK